MRRRTRRAARRSRSGARWRRRAAGTSSARDGSRAGAWGASGRATRSGSWGCAPATPAATTPSSSAAPGGASSSSPPPPAPPPSPAGRRAPRLGGPGGVFARGGGGGGGVVPAHRRLAPRSSWLGLGVTGGGHVGRLAARLFPHALLVRTNDNRALAELLASGAADAILTDEAEADALAVPGAVRLGPFTRDRKAYLGRDPALVAELDAWLRTREADGTLAALRARWLGATRAAARSAFASDLDALLALVDLRLAFMPAGAAAQRKIGPAVGEAGQEAGVLGAGRGAAAAPGPDPPDAE